MEYRFFYLIFKVYRSSDKLSSLYWDLVLFCIVYVYVK